MRKSNAVAVFCLTLFLSAAIPAYATTDCSAGVPYASGGFNWVDYSAEALWEQKTTWDCWTLFNLSPTTLDYFWSTPGFEIRGLSGSATRSFTVPPGAGGHYDVSLYVELIDPNNDVYNQLGVDVAVYHPGFATAWYNVYYHNGAQGSQTPSWPYTDFYVEAGDTITIYIQGAWSLQSDSHARFSNVHINHRLNF